MDNNVIHEMLPKSVLWSAVLTTALAIIKYWPNIEH
jgi:hypothetical protein